MLPSEFKEGKLQAYRLICEMMTKHQDVLPNREFLVHLYDVMHKGFNSNDQVSLWTKLLIYQATLPSPTLIRTLSLKGKCYVY